jgi:hypothetical protein
MPQRRLYDLAQTLRAGDRFFILGHKPMKLLLILGSLFLFTQTANAQPELIKTCQDWNTLPMTSKIYYVEGYLVGVITEARIFKRTFLQQDHSDFIMTMKSYCDLHPKVSIIDAIIRTQ